MQITPSKAPARSPLLASRCNRPAAAHQHILESLEPRRLLSTTFLYQEYAEAFTPGALHDLSVSAEASALGISVAGVGDVDGDGIGDFLVGLAGRSATDDEPAVAGAARLHSGATGAVLFDLTDGNAGFGAAVAGVGDLNDDGVPDFLVGSPLATNPDLTPNPGEHGLAYLYSGANGALLRTLGGVGPGFAETSTLDHFGHAVSRIGDTDGDGVGDLLVGAPGAGDVDQGEVYLFSGATGALLRTFSGEAPGDRFGFSIADAGDIPAALGEPGDGVSDVLVGAPGVDAGGLDTETGKAYVFDSITGDLVLSFTPELDDVNFGHAVAAVIDAPGEIRLAIGAPSYDSGRGLVFLYTPHTAAVHAIHYGEPGSRFGSTLANVGDVRGFGTDVLAVGAPAHPDAAGGMTVFLRTAEELALQRIGSVEGYAAAGAGDLDGEGGDGLGDVIVAFAGDADGPGAVRVLSGATIEPLTIIDGASDNLAYAWSNTLRRLVVNGRQIAYSEVPGLGDASIIAISDSGQILAREGDFINHHPFLIVDAERISIPDDVTEVVGRELTDGPFFAVDIGEQGQVILVQNVTEGETLRHLAWLFQGGVLTFLWEGDVQGINASGHIVGNRQSPEGAGPVALLRAPDGSITELAGFTAHAIADDGVVAGFDTAAGLALWHAGVLTDLVPEFTNESVSALATGGRILVHSSGTVGRIGFEQVLYREPGADLSLLNNRVEPNPLFFTAGLRIITMSDDGRIFTNRGILTPVDTGEDLTPAPGAPVATAAQGEAVTSFTLNSSRELIAFHNGGSGWIASELQSSAPLQIGPNELFTAFTDAGDGRIYIVIAGPSAGTRLYRVNTDTGVIMHIATLDAGAPEADRITGNLTTFTSTDGRAHIAGTNEAGEWVLFFQTGGAVPAGESAAWGAANLSRDHLAPQGISAPTLTGVAAYVTPWNAINIVGIDASGDIHAIWWAPGLELWLVNNLSAVARDNAARHALPMTIPAFTGNVTAFVTPWNAIHIAATTGDTDATPLPRRADEVGVLWWAPGLEGAWQSSVLGPPAGGDSPTFAPGSLASFVTPWGGLTIAGIASEAAGAFAAGEIVVYWWSPASVTEDNPTGWNLSSIHDVVAGATPPSVAGRLAAAVTSDGQQHLFATNSEVDALLNFGWAPESGSMWAMSQLAPIGV